VNREVLNQSKSSSSSTVSLDMAHAETFEVVPQLIHPTEVVKNNVFVGGGATYGSSDDLTLGTLVDVVRCCRMFVTLDVAQYVKTSVNKDLV
jgi:hypothetical protein